MSAIQEPGVGGGGEDFMPKAILDNLMKPCLKLVKSEKGLGLQKTLALSKFSLLPGCCSRCELSVAAPAA